MTDCVINVHHKPLFLLATISKPGKPVILDKNTQLLHLILTSKGEPHCFRLNTLIVSSFWMGLHPHRFKKKGEKKSQCLTQTVERREETEIIDCQDFNFNN